MAKYNLRAWFYVVLVYVSRFRPGCISQLNNRSSPYFLTNDSITTLCRAAGSWGLELARASLVVFFDALYEGRNLHKNVAAPITKLRSHGQFSD